MGGNKKDPAGEKLVAHDEAEGKSDAGRALFKELCDAAVAKGKLKELRTIHVGRVLDGQRRVTRDMLFKVMDLAEIPAEERSALWERYFGGKPDSIAQEIRRRIILTGSIRGYGEKVDLSHPSLCWIMDNRATTAEAFRKIMTNDPDLSLPWKGPDLVTQWRHEHEDYHMRKFQSNLFAARVETLFQMRPTASRIEWVERGNMPASLKDMSKNRIRILLSALRHGEPTPWQDVDRVLFGMDCTLVERVEVAHAWLQAVKNPPGPRKKREESSEETDEKRKRGRPALPNEPIPQNPVPYPTELVDQPDLEIIRKLLEELKSTDEKQETFVAEVSTVLGEVEAIEHPAVTATPAAPPPEKKSKEKKPREKKAKIVDPATQKKRERKPRVIKVVELETAFDATIEVGADETEDPAQSEDVLEDPETKLFGAPREPSAEEELDDDEDERALPDFTKYNSVWLLAEFMENFIARESAGYGSSEEAFLTIATEVHTRAPLGINDTASAMKMLMYCIGRAPESEAAKYLIDAIEQSIGSEGDVPVKSLMALLTAERRFRMFLLYYRDQHPDSNVTKLMGSITDLESLEKPEKFDPHAMTDKDKDYHEKLRPTPKQVKTDKEKKRDEARYKYAPQGDADSEDEEPWEDD